ncbi:MAG: GDPmannose 4,6-dehydratase [Thermoleophilaceae bacterium]|jgi:GDPmannose 4,6-dehydratase|nr:GDPmannose 4,6-dehydratase [Thermoleophilaceae bacterium]
MSRTALITGITGQDGSYLAELLLEKGYEVHGLARRTSSPSHGRIDQILERVTLHSGDLIDQRSIRQAMELSQPDEIYNLGAMSYVAASWYQPVLTGEITGMGVTNVLESMRDVAPEARFYQASSSEMYGTTPYAPQDETTPFHPRSPYGVAKVFGHHLTINYRESFGLYCCSGILFNHESPRRGIEFVTRKISRTTAEIKLGLAEELRLGNLEAKRDWGHARDYVEAMWLMLQQPEPDDYVVATGEEHSVREFTELAFEHAGLDFERHVRTDPGLLRPADIENLLGDSSKARERLGWQPRTSFEELVRLMVDADLEDLARAR